MRTLSLVLGTAFLGLAGCNLNTDYFSEYRGKNLLSNYDFNAVEADGTPKWSTTVGSSYMGWAQATDLAGLGLSVGPDGTSPAYRLEIKNLIPDGDFETEVPSVSPTAFPATPAGWNLNYVGTTAKYRFNISHPNNLSAANFSLITPLSTIANMSFLFSAQNPGNSASLSLDVAATSLWVPGQYRLRLDFINVKTTTALGFQLTKGNGAPLSELEAQDSGLWNQNNLMTASSDTVASLSKTFTVAIGTDTRRFNIGTNGQQDAVILDNVRLLLAVGDLSATASLPSLSSGSLQLLPGTKPGAYQFTIRVRDDPTADQTGGSGIAHTNNRFYPSGLSITIRGKAKNSPGSRVLLQHFEPRPSGGWAGWTTLSLSGGLDFVDTDADLGGTPALTVSLTPTNDIDDSTDGKDVGSLLVSQPTLTFNP